MKVGVVCEGLNDFLALRAIIEEIATRKDIDLDKFDSLQPRIDATSQTQLDTGGWPRVKVWLEDNSGVELRKVLAPRIFSASTSYDLLVIHLDGDVVGLCNDFNATARATCFGRPDVTVQTVESFIEQILNPPDALDDQIIYAVPVLHTEAWLIAASSTRAIKRNIETVRTKEVGCRYLKMKYKADLKTAAEEAARQLGKRLEELRLNLYSLEHFAAKIDAATA
jgi:hypothetical protein